MTTIRTAGSGRGTARCFADLLEIPPQLADDGGDRAACQATTLSRRPACV